MCSALKRNKFRGYQNKIRKTLFADYSIVSNKRRVFGRDIAIGTRENFVNNNIIELKFPPTKLSQW